MECSNTCYMCVSVRFAYERFQWDTEITSEASGRVPGTIERGIKLYIGGGAYRTVDENVDPGGK